MSKHIEAPEVGNLFFAVGDSTRTFDVIQGDSRKLIWPTVDYERDLVVARIAGWSDMTPHYSEGFGELNMPVNTRSAANVLSGVAAWHGEKDEILAFIAQYIRDVRGQFGAVDTSVSLDSIGISRDGLQKFVTPPHNLNHDQNEVSAWAAAFYADLDAILVTDGRGPELLQRFVVESGIGPVSEA